MLSITVPGSKSITNRAVLAASLAGGKSILKNFLESEDTRYMRDCLKKLGIVRSTHSAKLKKAPLRLFCGNAGTVLRFLTAVLAAQSFKSVIDGNARMRQRPIGDLVNALRQLGAHIEYLGKKGFPPLAVRGPMNGGACILKSSISSQFLSGLLLAAPLAKKSVTIEIKGELVSKPYVDLTIAIMKRFDVKVAHKRYKEFFIKAGQKYKRAKFTIEGDASSASYFWAISALAGEPIKVTNIPKNSKQADAIPWKTGIYNAILQQAQGNITINCEDFPDSAMTLAVLSAFRRGKTTLTGLSNLRVKECDRIHALATELRKIGTRAIERKDGLEIYGDPDRLHDATITTYNDHRIAMCFGMANFVLPGIKIKNPSCVKKTYPNFWKDLAALKNKFCEKNIILTGMRGCGKTKLGRILGRLLGRRFIDTDELIERTGLKTIPEIVAQKGWRYFRNLERRIVKRLHAVKHAVIATGGGTLMYPGNARRLKQNGKIIFLDCSIASLKKRIRAKADRPSLTGKKDFLAELAEIYKKRGRRYRKTADAIVDVSKQTINKKRDLENKIDILMKTVERMGISDF